MADKSTPVLQFETFRDIGAFERSGLTQNKPSCFNGMVRVVKYRVTVEVVDEPIEVIHARLLALWEAADNSHHWRPLQAAGRRHGIELTHEMRGRK